MNKLVVLNLGFGNLQEGFGAVTARLLEAKNTHSDQLISLPAAPAIIGLSRGSLPAAPEIPVIYKQWQLLYSALYERYSRIKTDIGEVKSVSFIGFSDLCQELSNRINSWLNAEPFRKIDQELRTYLKREDEIRLIIETDDDLLRRLPWHLWNFFEDYPQAEVALSAPEYKRAFKLPSKPPGASVRILAILGNSKGIDTEKDRAILEHLSDADTEFLVEPQLQELSAQLWNNWDILFFAGHSSSKEKGIIQLNQSDSLSLDLLRVELQKAISSGLKLAIFNSCDGLRLADLLADLHIPQVIVMREPVPDVVAQEFLKHFLVAFSGGQSLSAAVRSARERLRSLEGEYPCASWLPVIWQNPAEPPTTWQELFVPKQDSFPLSTTEPKSRPAPKPNSLTIAITEPKSRPAPKKRRSLASVLLASIAVTAGVMGVRHLGMLQNWELQAFDQLVRHRPDENPDPRILVVAVTETDFASQDRTVTRGSISDWALNKTLRIIKSYKPRVMGLDIYRDLPITQEDLGTFFANSEMVAVCKVRAPESGEAGVAPPPGVAPERLGFSDVLQDDDGVTRRHLLAMDVDPASPCTASYAFSVELAMRYLAAEGVPPKTSPGGFLQIGNVVFRPLDAHNGGYQTIDGWGHQVLLNYRSPRAPQNVVAQVPLMQVLKGKLDPDLVKDRIVIIGTTANSFGDLWTTPYSRAQSARRVPGVLIQAQMVSQIISAVLDGRPMLWVWSFWGEALWIWSWSLVGGILAISLRYPLRLALAGGTAFGVLYALCFGLLLLKGAWVPFVPSAIALFVAGGIMVIYSTSIKHEYTKKQIKNHGLGKTFLPRNKI